MADAVGSKGLSHSVHLREGLARVLRRQEFSLMVAIIAIGIVATIRNPDFMDINNVTEIFRASVMYSILACGGALVIIAGGLDFSVGAVFTLGSLVAGLMMVSGVPTIIAVLSGIGAGCVVGAINFLVVDKLHVPAIIATLGTFFILSGANTQLTQGQDVLGLPKAFREFGRGSFLGVPLIVWAAIVLALLSWLALDRTPFGIMIRAVGGNRNAAVSNGIAATRLDFWVYLISGGMAASAGIIHASRLGSAQVQAGGPSVTLNAITAILIGGVSLFGGLGTIMGVVLGAILLAVINNAIILSHISPQYNQVIIGAVLIAAVTVDYFRRQRLYRRQR